MKKRRGASLINVMVFMMFTVMITAQVFFFSKTSSDSLAESREIMLYRLRLDSLVEDAKDKLKIQTGTDAISHDLRFHNASGEPRVMDYALHKLKFNEFYDYTKKFEQISGDWKLSIHDLDYSFDATGEGGSAFGTTERTTWTSKYGNTSADKKVFAAMYVPIVSDDVTRNDSGDITAVNYRYYLIRARAKLPENYYGRKLMYQVLIRRNETVHNDIETLSFQEVWY